MHTRWTRITIGLLVLGGWSGVAALADNWGFSFHYGNSRPYSRCVSSYAYSVPSFRYYEPRTYVYTTPRTYVYSAPSTYVYSEPSSYVYSAPVTYAYAEPETYVYTQPSTYVYREPSVYVSTPRVIYNEPIYTTTYTRSDCYRYPSGGFSIRVGGDRCESRPYYRSSGYSSRGAIHVNRPNYAPSNGLRISFGQRESSRRTVAAPAPRRVISEPSHRRMVSEPSHRSAQRSVDRDSRPAREVRRDSGGDRRGGSGDRRGGDRGRGASAGRDRRR